MIFDRLQELLGDAKVIFELGGCDGNETCTFVRLFPYARITVLEPVPHLAQIIRERSQLRNKKVTIIQKAIGNKIGRTTLHVSSGNCTKTGQSFYGSSSVKTPLNAEKVFDGMKFNDIECSVTTLDRLWEDAGKPVIDFLWADIQGAEREMIEGGAEALNHTRYMFTEVKEGDYYEGEISGKEILDMLPDWELLEDFGTDILIRNTKF